MEIQVKEIHTKKELKDFVKFQMDLYKGNRYFVPSLISDEITALNTPTSPAYQSAAARYFLAYKNGKNAGRIVAIMNHYEVIEQQIKKGRVCYIDVIDE